MKSRFFLALDKMSETHALALTHQLKGRVVGVKGHAIFDKSGTGLIRRLKQTGVSVWADMKFNDTPDTVVERALVYAEAGADIITAHASGGFKMLNDTVNAVSAYRTKVLAITVLTSLDDEDCLDIFAKQAAAEAMQLARIAAQANAYGIVCSAHEVELLAGVSKAGNLQRYVPGTRSLGVDLNDQKRSATAAEALKSGADVIVLGREVTKAADPIAAIDKIEEEIRISQRPAKQKAD